MYIQMFHGISPIHKVHSILTEERDYQKRKR